MGRSKLNFEPAMVDAKNRAVVRRSPLRLLSCQSGATAIEYAVMISGIAGVIIATVYALGGTTLGLYEAVQGAFDMVMN